MLPRSRWYVAALALCLPASLPAQNVPTRALPAKPDAEFEEPFTQVGAIRELKDGRVIVMDSRDKVVQVVDLRSGATEKIGREGSGPGEYALPLQLLALPGDSSLVFDMLNRRLLVVTPSAKPGGFVTLPSADAGRDGGRGGMVMVGGMTPTASDARGRLYAAAPPLLMTPEGPKTADSVAIERWDRATGKRDTVAFLAVPKGAAQVSGGGRGGRGDVSVRIGGSSGPFPEADQWAVAPDGRVAIVHLNPYRVDFVSGGGARIAGQPIRMQRVKVTEGHKAQWREERRNALGIAITNDNGRMSAQTMVNRNVQDPAEWPEYLPPFLANAARFAPDGRLWIRRTTPADEPPTYDVIDGNGRVVERVLLPKRTRLAGFGTGVVYAVRSDEDDLQYLQRYRFAMAERP